MADENQAEGTEPEEPAGGETTPAEEEVPRRRVNTIVAVSIVVLALIVAAGVYFSFKFVEDERQRALNEWQIRLGIVADSRVAAVNEWVKRNMDVIAELTENQSLQLYMTELAEAQGDRGQVTDGAAEEGYLRNLLIAMADRNGFSPPAPVQEVDANVERVGTAGMALTDPKGNPIVVTPEMPPPQARHIAAIAKAAEGEPAYVDMYRGSANDPTMGFALPVYAVQEDSGGARAIGVAIGVRVVGKDLFDRLKQPGDTSQTAETFLVRKNATTIEYLTPLRDGTAALTRSMDVSTADLASAFAFDKPGGFAIKKNYLGEDVLVTSRPIAGLGWMLVREITSKEALSANENRLRTILIVFVGLIVLITIAMIAVWRHGTSLRAAAAAEKFRIAAERFENISKFMRVVTNSQPTAIVAVDGTTSYTFANEPAARQAGITPEDMLGKTMASVMGPLKARYYADINRELLAEFADAEAGGMEDSVQRTRKQFIHTFDEEEEIEVIKSDHIPLRGDRDHPPGVLMVLDDITEYSRERLRSEARMRQLVGTLVNVVDRRDPLSANRSNNIARVAGTLARELECEQVDIDTVEFAGNLLSLGNVYIPAEVLGRPDDQLTDEERASIDTAYQVSAELLEGVDFEGPVVDTIRQSREHIDGTGPQGLAGDAILLPARIVAVAAAFVDRVSPSANGDGESFDAASNALLQESGTIYDRKVVTALLNYLENRGGGEEWAGFSERPA